MAGYPFISSHTIPILLQLEAVFDKNTFRMPFEVWHSADDGLCAFKHCSFITQWSSEHRDTLQGCDQVSLGMDIVAIIKRVWRYL